ncbi:MAG: CBS domain-containing protein [Armatimonadetes bacterium]|nr:CBS domain-containing protein [Armatimonadota bacterium]
MVARDIMTSEVVTIGEQATAREAADLLLRLRYDAVPVVNAAGDAVGIVSYEDLIRLALPEYLDDVDLSFLPASAPFLPAVDAAAICDVQVASFMRRDRMPEVSPEEPVAEIARIMLRDNVRRVAVMEEGRLAGIISRGDVVRAIVSPLMTCSPG